jgi:hypothetical protein
VKLATIRSGGVTAAVRIDDDHAVEIPGAGVIHVIRVKPTPRLLG